MLLTKFPLPPSSNKLYASVRGRLVKSAEGRKYDRLVYYWANLNRNEIDRVNAFANLFEVEKLLYVDTIFVFHKDRVIGKKGQIKKLDASNRIKQLHDHLAKLIEVDDSYFVQGSFSKAICDNVEEEQVIIRFNKGKIRTLDEIKREAL